MYGFLALVIIVQALCAYHAYRTNAQQRWYWMIILLPVAGSIVYLINNFGNNTAPDTKQGNMKDVIGANYKIQKLEAALKHSDNVTNQILLADAYTEAGRYNDAIALYESSSAGFMADDIDLRMKRLWVYYLKGDFAKAVEMGKMLEDEKAFRNSEERAALAWSYHHTGHTSEALVIFESLDTTFTNYMQRLEYCRFLEKTKNLSRFRSLVRELMSEFNAMHTNERNQYNAVFNVVKGFYSTLPVR